MVELKGVSQLGFVPFSRMDVTRLPEDAAVKSTDMAPLVGEPIKTKIIQARGSRTQRLRLLCTLPSFACAPCLSSMSALAGPLQSAGCRVVESSTLSVRLDMYLTSQ